MNWEGIAAICALIGMILAVLGNVGVFAFFAGKIVTKLEGWTTLFERFEKSYENSQREQNNQRKAMWEKIDTHSEVIAEYGQRLKHLEG